MKWAFIVVLIACVYEGVAMVRRHLVQDARLPAKLHEKGMICAGQNLPLRISDLTDYDWDRVCLCCPYASETSIESVLGFKWSSANTRNLEMGKTFHVLLFVKDDKVIREARLGRDLADFKVTNSVCVFLRGEDSFVVSKDADGSARLVYTLAPRR